MQLWLFACIVVFSGTLATKIDIGENEGVIKNELVSCLFSIIETVCPLCIRSVNFVIPTKSSPGADSLAESFSNFASIHGITIDVADGPYVEDTFPDDVMKYRIYLIDSKADLTWFADNFSLTKHKVHQIFLLNYDVGPNLAKYLQDVLPPAWYGCEVWSILFLASIKDESYAYGKLPQGFSPCITWRFKRLRFCNSETAGEYVPPLEDAMFLFENSSVTVIVIPPMKPYVIRATDNPGGVVGNLMDTVKDMFNITVKYEWPVGLYSAEPMEFMIKDGRTIIFDMMPLPRKFLDLRSSVFLNMDEAKWVLVSSERAQSSLFEGLGGASFFRHLVLFLIFSTVTVFIVADPDKIKIVVRLFGMFLGVAVGWFPKKPFGRCMVILWCLTSYIIVQAYLAMLTSNLSLLTRFHPMSDISTAVENEIDVFCSPALQQQYCNFNDKTSIYLCKKSETQLRILLQRINKAMNNKSKVLRPFAYASSLLIQNSDERNDWFYNSNDKIGSWPLVIHTHNQAIGHMEMITRFTFWRLWEAGIIQFWTSRLELKPKYDYNFADKENRKTYWKMLSIILYLGYILSCLVFLIEILVHKYWKN